MASEIPSSILLKAGTVITHDAIGKVVIKKTDVLLENSTIAAIGDGLFSTTATIIDCTGKIVCPGFVDTHHHVWQTHLRGVHADETLLDYFSSGNFMSSFYSPELMFWGQLAGCLEMIDSGTTTVVDHASLTLSSDHPDAAIKATIASGIRSVFAFTPTGKVASWKPTFELDYNVLAPWVMDTWNRLATANPFGPNGRVRLGFAFDGMWLPDKALQDLFAKVRAQGSHLITTHAMNCAMLKTHTIKKLSSCGLLGPDILLSHANNLSPEDLDVVKSNRVSISSTPSTELQMGHGHPICFSALDNSSLGIDCHSACAAFLPAQMNLALQVARADRNRKLDNAGMWPNAISYKVEDAFNLGTIRGAKAIGLDKEIGTLEVGKRADVIIFEGTSPSMLAVSERDPVAAIVMHSSPKDVQTVIVDGVIRKQDGQLLPIHVPRGIESDAKTGSTYSWDEVMKEVVKGMHTLDALKMATCDPKIAKEGLIKAFHIDPNLGADNSQ